MKRTVLILTVALCAMCACNSVPEKKSGVAALIDSLNAQAFDLRYKNIPLAKARAARALKLIEERMPDYHDARAQAWNNLAYANFMISGFDSTRYYIGRVRDIEADYPNRAIEEAITYITEARLHLRECHYADAFKIYDSTITIFKGPLRRLRYGGNKRYDWARSDYLIGNAVLDYYYRKTELPDILPSLRQVERDPRLHIDTTQLSVLCYTFAGSYEQAIAEDADNIYLALDYVEKGLDLMANPVSRNDHQLANMYQITGNILTSEGTATWLSGPDSVEIRRRFDGFKRDYFVEKYGWNATEVSSPEFPLLLLLRADSLFLRCDDPYQVLASSLHIGDYYLAEGDRPGASDYLSRGVVYDSIIAARGAATPIWTSRLYNTLIVNATERNTPDQLKRWYAIYTKNKAVIDENTERDYNTQKERAEAVSFARSALLLAGLILVICAVVSVLLYFLWKRNRQLRFMQKKLIEQKRMELLTHVVRGISHELSQPLGTITQTLYDTQRDVATLGRGGLSEERHAELVGNVAADLQVIARGKESISDLVNSFRNTIRENVVDPEVEFNLAAKLDDIVKVVRPGIKSNIDLAVDCPPDLTVRTFPLLFSQVVTNLIANADQHAFPDPDAVGNRIRIVCREAGGDLVFKCIDNGIGIPADELERLCQPFVSKRNSGKNLGLGLSLIKNIVELYMNGTIDFSSGEGLTVTVVIPGCIVKR